MKKAIILSMVLLVLVVGCSGNFRTTYSLNSEGTASQANALCEEQGRQQGTSVDTCTASQVTESHGRVTGMCSCSMVNQAT